MGLLPPLSAPNKLKVFNRVRLLYHAAMSRWTATLDGYANPSASYLLGFTMLAHQHHKTLTASFRTPAPTVLLHVETAAHQHVTRLAAPHVVVLASGANAAAISITSVDTPITTEGEVQLEFLKCCQTRMQRTSSAFFPSILTSIQVSMLMSEWCHFPRRRHRLSSCFSLTPVPLSPSKGKNISKPVPKEGTAEQPSSYPARLFTAEDSFCGFFCTRFTHKKGEALLTF